MTFSIVALVPLTAFSVLNYNYVYNKVGDQIIFYAPHGVLFYLKDNQLVSKSTPIRQDTETETFYCLPSIHKKNSYNIFSKRTGRCFSVSLKKSILGKKSFGELEERFDLPYDRSVDEYKRFDVKVAYFKNNPTNKAYFYYDKVTGLYVYECLFDSTLLLKTRQPDLEPGYYKMVFDTPLDFKCYAETSDDVGIKLWIDCTPPRFVCDESL